MSKQFLMTWGTLGLCLAVTVACGDSETTNPTGAGGNTTTGGNGGTTNTGGGGDGGMGTGGDGGNVQTLNGCTLGGASDESGQAAVTISDISAWSIPHSACIVVDVGTAVTWAGDFSFHPLAGGETPTSDAGSPITGNTPANGEVTITFDTAGEYPYFCTIHGTSMQGVIYVE